MGKKRKSQTTISRKNTGTEENADDQLLEKLNVLAEQKDLVVGSSAILRCLKHDILCLVIVSKGICSPLYHEMNMLCVFNRIPLKIFMKEKLEKLMPKVSKVSSIGIKKNVIIDEDLQKLISDMSKEYLISEIKDKNIETTPVKNELNVKHSIIEPKSVQPYVYKFKARVGNGGETNSLPAFIPFSSNAEDDDDDVEFPNYRNRFVTNDLTIHINDDEEMTNLQDSLI